jgi:hypothetical protein
MIKIWKSFFKKTKNRNTRGGKSKEESKWESRISLKKRIEK